MTLKREREPASSLLLLMVNSSMKGGVSIVPVRENLITVKLLNLKANFLDI